MAAAESENLVLGLGNILLKDDGIGVRLVRELQKKGIPPGVSCLEGGTALLDIPGFLGRKTRLLVVDALRGGGKPGTVYMLSEADFTRGEGGGMPLTSLHDLRILGLLQMPDMARWIKSWKIMGVEPQEIGPGCQLTPLLQSKLPYLTDRLCEEAKRMTAGVRLESFTYF